MYSFSINIGHIRVLHCKCWLEAWDMKQASHGSGKAADSASGAMSLNMTTA